MIAISCAGMDGFDDPADLISIVSAILMILLNAHNLLAVASIPTEAPHMTILMWIWKRV